MELAIENNDFESFKLLAEKTAPCRKHCYCIDKKDLPYCAFLLEQAVRLHRVDFIDYMLTHKFPVEKASLMEAAKHNDIELLQKLYDAGCRFMSYDDIFRYNITVATVKYAILHCECPIVGEFRSVVEYADDEALQWVYEHLCNIANTSTPNELTEIERRNGIQLITPSGYMTTVPPTNENTVFGWGCYDAALYHGDFERFLFVVNNKIPMFSSDKSFWKNVLSEKYAVYNLCISKSEWQTPKRKLHRQKILDWCIEHEFSLDSIALTHALEYKCDRLVNLLLDKQVSITSSVMSAALLHYNLDFCKELYARDCPTLKSHVWNSIAGECEQEKLEWLLEIQCPKPANLIADIIYFASKERLEWLLTNGFELSMYCWAALSNRYLLDDTTEMLEWLYEKQCPLDPDVADHMDICRPYASTIMYFIDRKMGVASDSD